MKKNRKARLAKKRKSPFARVLLAVFFIVLFVMLTVACADFNWYCTVSSRVVEGQKKAVEIRNEYVKNKTGNAESIISDLVFFSDNVKMTSVKDGNGNIVLNVGTYVNKKDDFEIDVKESDVLFAEGIADSVITDDSGDYDFDMQLDLLTGSSLKYLFSSLASDDYHIDGLNSEVMSIRVNYCFDVLGGETLVVSSVSKLYLIDVLQLLVTIAFGTIVVIIIVIWNTISSIKAFRERNNLQELYYSDAISGGNNMQYFYDSGKSILWKYGRRNLYAIIDLRLEKYRNYCTCYGMEKGIELIEKIYQILDKNVGNKEILAHPEKADFALLLNYRTSGDLEERIRLLEEKLRFVDPDWESKFDVGIYLVEPGNLDIECMFNFAGVALSAGSDNNSDEMHYYTETMRETKIWENTVEHDMQRALDCEEFKVFLQPKYSTKEEVLSGAEALVRWVHPERGFISPGKFIPIFENNGFILKLDDFMISHVARIQAKWMSEGKRLVPISVNVSRAHFTRPDLAEHICGLVDMYNVPHQYIELEITESSFFDDKEALINTVKKLKSYGFEISMDDFGAGYSSLNSLKEIPLDVLKLDAEFFRGNDEEGRGDVIVGEAITLAKKLDMRIVAEGIETREQVDSLADKECDLIQGFYFAKPMPIDEFEQRAYATNTLC